MNHKRPALSRENFFKKSFFSLVQHVPAGKTFVLSDFKTATEVDW